MCVGSVETLNVQPGGLGYAGHDAVHLVHGGAAWEEGLAWRNREVEYHQLFMQELNFNNGKMRMDDTLHT